MNSLDTNAALRYLLNDIPEQTIKARSIIAGSPCYVTDVVLTEIVFVLERVIGMERSDIVRLVKTFLSLPNVVYNDYFLDEVIDLYGAKQPLSFVDCYAATEARIYGNTLVTFDKALAKHGGKHVQGL
ncbi:MAG TPA: PIN domain-containing protein [Candidatus Saccharimonadales bacterium]|nr:PIN domain-containing protein [Candidatus Saccharimonadales bacterium]